MCHWQNPDCFFKAIWSLLKCITGWCRWECSNIFKTWLRGHRLLNTKNTLGNIHFPSYQQHSGTQTALLGSNGSPAYYIWAIYLQWRHNGRDGFSNHQPHDCLLNRLFGCISKKISKLRVTGLCAGNSPVIGEFPTQIASNADNVSIWWRHHVMLFLMLCWCLNCEENRRDTPDVIIFIQIVSG